MVDTLNSQTTEGYVIRHISVSCPECQCGFAAPTLVDLPPVTEYDTIEADLHRVLPHADLRGSLISVCPHCNYATWTALFRASSLNPEMLPDSLEVPNAKKFALAVKYARDKNVSPLDIAFIALNGLYCARESAEDADLWLELAAYEQSRGIAEESMIPATGQDFLIMAELWRQLGSFDNAVAAYEKAYEDEFIPRELLDQQKKICAQGITSQIVLPPYMVRQIYPDAPEMTERLPVAKNGRPIPPFIERRPKPEKLGMDTFGPPERRTPLSSAVAEEPVPAGVVEEDSPIELSIESAPAAKLEAPEKSVAAVAPATPAAAAQQAAVSNNSKSEEIPVARVRQIIAQPSGASAIYLVQAAQVPQLDAEKPAAKDVAAPRGGKGRAKTRQAQPQQDPLPRIDMPSNEYFAGASAPEAAPQGQPKQQPAVSPMQRAVNKAMRKEKEGDRFPDIQLTDEYAEENYAANYDGYDYAQENPDAYEDAGAQQAQAPAAAAGGSGDYAGAVAAVESFLNLRRSPSYQNWVRSYKQ